MSHEAIDHPDGHQFHDSVKVKMGSLTPLAKMFLDDAGEASNIFYDMVKKNFDPNTMVEQCGETAKSHGFWNAHAEKARKILAGVLDSNPIDSNMAVGALVEARLLGDPTIFLALMGTEISEAIEGYRKGNTIGKDGMWEELADVVVRLFDFIARYGPDDNVDGYGFMALVAAKMAKNESRSHLHGKGF